MNSAVVPMLRPTPADGSYCTTRNAKTYDLDLLQSLALTISTRLSCIALASFNADDDILWLGVYEDGKLATRYSSERKHFADAGESRTFEACSAESSRNLKKGSRLRRYSADLMAY